MVDTQWVCYGVPGIRHGKQLSKTGYAVVPSGKLVGEKSWTKKVLFGNYKDAWGFTLYPEVEYITNSKTKKNSQWYEPPPPVIDPSKPGTWKNDTCRWCSEWIWRTCSKRSLLLCPDLLPKIIGITFCFRERHFGMSADIEAMSLEVKVPAEDSMCLRLVWWKKQADNLSTYEYARLISGAKDSPTCAKSAF